MSIKTAIAGLSTPVKVIGGLGLAIVLAIVLWFYGAKLWNGVGNYVFHRREAALEKELSAEKAKAEQQKKAIDQTLMELAASKKTEAAAVAHSKELEGIFNDKSKTAAEKLQAYKDAMSAAPTHTDTSGVTLDSLCARAKSSGASPETIAALCGQ